MAFQITAFCHCENWKGTSNYCSAKQLSNLAFHTLYNGKNFRVDGITFPLPSHQPTTVPGSSQVLYGKESFKNKMVKLPVGIDKRLMLSYI